MKRKAVKQHRDCESCIAYYNILGGREYRCGLGFQIAEEIETERGVSCDCQDAWNRVGY